MTNGPPRDVQNADSLPEAILRLNKHYGSADKTARALGMGPNGRFTVMRWQEGSFPIPEYRERLAAAGVPRHLLTPPESLEELWGDLRRLEAGVAEFRRALEERGPEPR